MSSHTNDQSKSVAGAGRNTNSRTNPPRSCAADKTKLALSRTRSSGGPSTQSTGSQILKSNVTPALSSSAGSVVFKDKNIFSRKFSSDAPSTIVRDQNSNVTLTMDSCSSSGEIMPDISKLSQESQMIVALITKHFENVVNG